MRPYSPDTPRGRIRARDDVHHGTADQPRKAAKADAKALRHGARQEGREICRIALLEDQPEIRHTIVRGLRPTCTCTYKDSRGVWARFWGAEGCKCGHRTWVPPPRKRGVPPPRKRGVPPISVVDCAKRLLKLEESLLTDVNTDQELEDWMLAREDLLIWLARHICTLPGQPNSFDKYMLLDVREMLPIYEHYRTDKKQ